MSRVVDTHWRQSHLWVNGGNTWRLSERAAPNLLSSRCPLRLLFQGEHSPLMLWIALFSRCARSSFRGGVHWLTYDRHWGGKVKAAVACDKRQYRSRRIQNVSLNSTVLLDWLFPFGSISFRFLDSLDLFLLWVQNLILQSVTEFYPRLYSFSYDVHSIVGVIVFLFVVIWPRLWSSGHSSWLLTQRSRVRFQALPHFLSSSGSGTGSSQPLWG
jgi:hypothetical protein